MKLLPGIVPQETFPRVDVTADNAQLLSLLLANRDMRLSMHDAAESHWLYQSTHQAIWHASQQLAHPDQTQALNHGVITYEAMAALLRPCMPVDRLTAERTGIVAAGPKKTIDIVSALESAGKQFSNMPNTASVVGETAEYAYPLLGAYAVYGAALARQMELEAVG